MINLLPPKEKEQLVLESNRKLTIVLGNIVLVSLVSLVLVLFSLKFYILEQLVLQKSTLSDIEKNYQSNDFIVVKENMQRYNGFIIKMYNFYNDQAYLSDSLKIISEVNNPNGLYFKSINLDNTGNGGADIKITGFSNTRENLQLFKNNIEEIKKNQSIYKIENIYFPPYVWLKANDIDFNLTFKIVKNDQSK